MALGVSEPIAESVDNADGTSYSHLSGAFTPSANAILAVWVNAAGTTVTSPTLSGGSLTWTLQQEETYNSISKLFLFTAPTGSSPASCTLVFDCTGDAATGCIMGVLQFTGSNISIVQTADDAGTGSANPATTFASNLNTNNAYGAGWAASRNPPGSSGWGTEICDAGHTSPTSGLAVAYKINGETGTSIQFTASSTNWAIAGIEIAEGGDKTVSPSVLSSVASVQGPVPNNYSLPSVLSSVAGLQSSTPVDLNLPSALSSVASVQSPAISAGNTQSPAVLSAIASAQAPVPIVTQSPDVLSPVSSIQAPSISAGNTQSPAVISAVAAVQAPTPNVTKDPTILSVVASVIAPTVTTGAADTTVSPSVLSALASLLAPTPAITVDPSVLSAHASAQVPGVVMTISPSVLSAIASVLTLGVESRFEASVLSAIASAIAPGKEVLVLPSVLSAIANLQAPQSTLQISPTALSAISSVLTPLELQIVAHVSVLGLQIGIIAPLIVADIPAPIKSRPGTDRDFSAAGAGRSRSHPGSSRTYSNKGSDQH